MLMEAQGRHLQPAATTATLLGIISVWRESRETLPLNCFNVLYFL